VWDTCARVYERRIVGGLPAVRAYEAFEEDLLDALLAYLAQQTDAPLRLYDVGCGSGRIHLRYGLLAADDAAWPATARRRLARARLLAGGVARDPLLARRLVAVDGLDFSAEMLAIAREKIAAAGLGALIGPLLRLAQGSAFELAPLPADPLPVAVTLCNSIGVMQGPDGAAALFKALRRAVADAGGIALISAYRREAVASHALGNYESTINVSGQPLWLAPATYAGSDYVQIPRAHKPPFTDNPKIAVEVFDHAGRLVKSHHVLARIPETTAATVATGHIRTHGDYESRWYAFDHFAQWIAEHWSGLRAWHLAGRQIDALRGAPAQIAILDPAERLAPLIARWRTS
jgi:SAM-dependent methyltransferase